MIGRQKFALWSVLPLALFALAAVLFVESWKLPPAGNYGYDADPAGAREFARQAGSFREVAADAYANARRRDVFLYRAVQTAHRKAYGRDWVCLDQGSAGTCVSFAFSLASYTAQAVDHVENPDSVPPPPAVATEPIYGGARTVGTGRSVHTGGDGATGFGAARWISGACPGKPEIGGVLYRQAYGDIDLSKYSIPLSRAWGRTGVPADLARIAYKTRATAVANVTTWDELVASLERGSPVVLCSGVGYGRFDNAMPVRDADAFLERGKGWGHAMLVWGLRFGDREGGLVQNSWGPGWCHGPKWPEDMPDGGFWADRKNIEAALEQGDCWSVAGVSGFSWRELDHAGWMEELR